MVLAPPGLVSKITKGFLATVITGYCQHIHATNLPQTVIHIYPSSRSIPAQDISGLSWSDFRKQASKGLLSGKYYFHEGKYDLASPLRISGDHPVILKAQKDAIFTGKLDSREKPRGGFVLKRGDIEFHNFQFQNIYSCIRIGQNATAKNVLVKSLKANKSHSCILMERGPTFTVNNWTLEDFNITEFYRTAVRISGQNSSDITIQGFEIDGGPRMQNHCFTGGIQIYSSAHNININNGKISNVVGACGSGYQQGDGIEIDDKQGAPYNITISNVTITDSGDANVDIKGENVTLHNVNSISHHQTLNAFKLWNYNTYTCDHCSAKGNAKNTIRLTDAEVNFVDFQLPQDDFVQCHLSKQGKDQIGPCSKILERPHASIDHNH